MTSAPISLSDLRRTFADPPAEARPMMRWWWFGPDVTRADIDRDLEAMAAGGIGGVEVAFEYPVSERPRRFGSLEFLADLAYAAERAGQLGLRFDLTLGSGWSFGGPHIGPEHAARKLHWERREIGPEAFEAPRGSGWPHDELIGAYVGPGSLQEPPDAYDPVPVTDDQLRVPEGVGPRVLLIATSRLTGQNVKRAAFGAEGPVHDHYSAAATLCHLDAVARPMVEAVGARRIGSVFCDSLEVYAADWTPGMGDIVAARRGYRPEPRLWLLVTEHPDAAAFRADFYRTLSELYEENFLIPLANWAHERGLRVRVQSYGEPPAALSSYRQVDLVEGEQWVWTGLPMTRWASSSAHHLGLDVVSSETWTWIHAPSFRATPLDLKGEAHEHALLGINQFIGHGWPCRSTDTSAGLGTFFYASGALDERNAWWPAMPSLMRYLQRLSWVLRQGTPVRDVLLYLPTDDAYAAFGPSIDLFTVSTGLIPAEIPRALREGGYDFDLIDDHFLAELIPDESTIVVLPGRGLRLSAATQARLAAVEAAGGRVILAEGAVEPDAPAGNERAERFLAELGGVRAPDVTLLPATPDIGAVHRSVGDVDVWFVANTGPEVREVRVVVRQTHPTLEVWDPVSGAISPGSAGSEGIALELHPYQGLLLIGHDEPADLAADRSAALAAELAPGDLATADLSRAAGTTRPERMTPIPAALTDWRLHDATGSDLGPVELPHRWEDDSRIGPQFSGTMSYVATVRELPSTGRLGLDFGPGSLDDVRVSTNGMEGRSYQAKVVPPVREVVEVLVDGRSTGVVWDAPWRLELGSAGSEVSVGSTLTLRVSNTTSNALAADTTVADWAARSERLHGRRFRMQALDRVLDGVSSGLVCVPELAVMSLSE